MIGTNYFHVNDEEQFFNFMSRVASNGVYTVDVDGSVDGAGCPVFRFYTDGSIVGIPGEADEGSHAYDDFIIGLQECVAEDDAVILIEFGESVDELTASATIVTSEETDVVDFMDIVTDRAMEMLRRGVITYFNCPR